MVREKARPHLESLSQLAPQLNKATDLFMEELKEIEAELGQLNLGISVEFSKWIHTENVRTEFNDDGESIGDYFAAWTLGYGRADRGRWCLLLREYQVPAVGQQVAHPVERDCTPLLHASRDLRIAAAEYLPALLSDIEATVKKKIEVLAKMTDKH